MATERFELFRGKWYAWQMIPGYAGGPGEVVPYFSPIFVNEVTTKPGSRVMSLTFFNALYASGVQGFQLDLGLIRRAETYLVAAIHNDDGSLTDRVAVISDICFEWIERFCASVWTAGTAKGSLRNPYDLQAYLHEMFGSVQQW
jgi:hypothetical protein